jgi:hypothetical protein
MARVKVSLIKRKSKFWDIYRLGKEKQFGQFQFVVLHKQACLIV